MTGAEDTTRQRRARLEVAASDAYRNALMDARITQEEAAQHIGKSRSRVKQLCSRDHDATPSEADVAMLPPEARRAFRQRMDSLLGTDASEQSNTYGRIDQMVQQSASVVSRLLNALEDGVIDAAEAEQIMPVALAVRDVAEEIYQSMRRKAGAKANVIGLAKARDRDLKEEAG